MRTLEHTYSYSREISAVEAELLRTNYRDEPLKYQDLCRRRAALYIKRSQALGNTRRKSEEIQPNARLSDYAVQKTITNH